MNIMEKLLIGKYQPPLNKDCKRIVVRIDFKEPEWIPFQLPAPDEYYKQRFDEDVSCELCETCFNPECERCPPDHVRLLYSLIKKTPPKKEVK